MKSADQILRDLWIGKTLKKREFDSNNEINMKILNVCFIVDEDHDSKILIDLWDQSGEEPEIKEIQVYMYEGLEIE